MAKRKTRRHPGVVLIKPFEQARIGWRVRYRDPDSGKMKKVTLDRSLRTKAQREDHACRLSDRLARRRRELEEGAPRATGTALIGAVERFYETHPQLCGRTHETYKLGTDRLLEWAASHQIKSGDDLTRAKLMGFREKVIAAPHQVTGERRSPHTINREIRAVKRVLGYLIDCDLCARLTHDDLRRIKQLPAPVERRHFLKAAELQRLLEAALRHDAATYALTREEKSKRKTPATPRFDPIAPFVMFVLLSGMRIGEALDLKWSEVDLDALDANGKKVGEIYITGQSKTARARTIGLEVSPALRRLLAAQRLRTAGKGSVWGVTPDGAIKAMRRLVKSYGAPRDAGWQALRRTCGTFLTNAPGIYGGASAFFSSRQLGHSITIAEKHYVGLLRGIQMEAKTLEAAMQIDDLASEVVASTSRSPSGVIHVRSAQLR